MLFNVSDASISLSSVVTFANPQLSAQQVTLKKDAPPAELEKAKQEARNSGGTIKHEYTLIKGFTVEYPDDHVKVLQTTEHLHVEQDGEVHTK